MPRGEVLRESEGVTRNVCSVCMDPVAEARRYRTGYRVLHLCDGCAERMRMERCRGDEDGAWPCPTYDMRRRRHDR